MRTGARRVRGAVRQALVFLGVIVVGAVVVFGIMALLGQLVLHGGPSIDKPINHWVAVAPDPHVEGADGQPDQDR